MADPTKYVPGYSYSDWQAGNPTKPLPANQIDNDFANLQQASAQAVDAIKDIRRSDGALQNQIVTLESLHPSVTLGLGSGGGDYSDLLAKIALKADAAATSTALAGKLGTTQAAQQFALKADTADVNSKAEITSFFGTRDQRLADLERDRVSIRKYGAVGDGVADDTAAIQAALNFAVANRLPLYIPSGLYKLTAKLTANLPAASNWSAGSLMIYGDGQGVSVLKFVGGIDGISITLNSERHTVHLRDFALHNTVQNAGTAIYVKQTYGLGQMETSSFRDLVIRGAETGVAASTVWGCGINVMDLSAVTIDSVTVQGNGHSANGHGIGFKFEGTARNNNGEQGFAIYHNIAKCVLNGLSYGIVYGSAAQGITITQTNIQNGNIGIHVPAGGFGLAQLNVFDCQIATYGTCILQESEIGPYTFRGNCLLPMDGADGIVSLKGSYGTIVGNQVNFIGTQGIVRKGIQVGGFIVNISGNVVCGFATGIEILAGSENIRAENNTFAYCTQEYSDAGVRNFIPGYGARFNRNSNYSLVAGLNIVPFDGLVNVIGNPSDNMSDGIWTCASEGVWEFTANITLNSNSSGTFILTLQKNGASNAAIATVGSPTYSQTAQIAMVSSGPIYMAMNDTIRVGVNVDIPRTVQLGNSTFFDARRIR